MKCIKKCKNCILNSMIPNVRINDEGECNFCYENRKNQLVNQRFKQLMQKKFEALVKETKQKKQMYDAIVLFSGGKDSTFLLKMASQKFNMRVLAVSIINPLVNEVAQKNMDEIADKMNIDLVKFKINTNLYIKAMKRGFQDHQEYGLDEFFGCSICSFFHYWIPIKFAIKMNIPMILEGSDSGQAGRPLFVEGKGIKKNIIRGYKPYGKIHDLIHDVLEPEMYHSIYDYDEDEIINADYPDVISPLTFVDYYYSEAIKEIEEMGLNSKKYSKALTNCALVPFLSYFTLKQYDCVPYVKQYANGIRNNMPILEQLIITGEKNGDFQKETIEKMLKEYKQIVLYIINNKLSEQEIMDSADVLIQMAPTYSRVYPKETIYALLQDIAKIPYYSEYFKVNLDCIE